MSCLNNLRENKSLNKIKKAYKVTKKQRMELLELLKVYTSILEVDLRELDTKRNAKLTLGEAVDNIQNILFVAQESQVYNYIDFEKEDFEEFKDKVIKSLLFLINY